MHLDKFEILLQLTAPLLQVLIAQDKVDINIFNSCICFLISCLHIHVSFLKFLAYSVDLLCHFSEENVMSPSQRRLRRLNLARKYLLVLINLINYHVFFKSSLAHCSFLGLNAELNTQSSTNRPLANHDRPYQSTSRF